MATLAIEGTYHGGKVELSEQPAGVDDARVMVVFLPNATEIDADTLKADKDAREAARQRAFARMKEGINLGGPPYPTREEIYDRYPQS